MSLSESQKKYLRGLGHPLKPVVTVGDAGVSESVLKEFDATIDHHELIKVRVRAADRKARDAAIEQLCEQGAAELVTRIGNVALMFRRNDEKPQIVLPATRNGLR
jgi:RNA-binding protein